MSDLKTVTFDAIREAVGRITEVQRRSGGPAWMEAKSLLANDLTFIAQGLIDALATAPTPAAQSAGQEEVLGYLSKSDIKWLRDHPDLSGTCVVSRKSGIAIYTAPVNGGERETVEVAVALEQQRTLAIVKAVRDISFGESPTGMPTVASAAYDLACEEIERRLRTEQWTLDGVPAPLPDADAPQAGGDEREAFEAEASILSYRIAKDEDGDYLALDTAIAFRLFKALKARAALSADGGERKDAELLDALEAVTNVLDAFGDLPDRLISPEAWADHDAEAKVAHARAIAAKAKGE